MINGFFWVKMSDEWVKGYLWMGKGPNSRRLEKFIEEEASRAQNNIVSFSFLSVWFSDFDGDVNVSVS